MWISSPSVYKSSATVEISAQEFGTEGVASTKENILDMPYKSDAVVVSFQGYLLASRVANKLGGKYTSASISKSIKAKSRSASLVTVSAKGDTPDEAQRILQAVLHERLLLDKERFSDVMKPLLEGIDAQLAELQRSIGTHYKQIAAYAGDKPDLEERRISGTGQAGIQASIAQLAGQTEDARIKLSKLNAAIAAAEKGNATTEGIQDFGESSYSFFDLKRQLAERTATLASLRSRSGDANPAVESARAQLNETKRFLIQGLRELAHQVETKLAGLVAARKSLEENAESLKKQTMTLLDRDPTYNMLVTAKDSFVLSYQQLLVKKYELAITSHMQPMTVQVLDVPNLPDQPYIIIKLAILGGAMIAGAFFGGFVAVLRTGVLAHFLPGHDQQ